MIGILVNIVLVIFKTAVGMISGSIAIILDAVNNLSDVMSSVITIIGTKLAGKAPDREHPFGHGRVEYLTSVLIAVMVLMAGIASLRESAEKIIHPTAAEYTAASIIIIIAGIIAKLLVGRYVKRVGEEIDSGSLTASGSDALFDSVLSMGTLAAAVISMVWKLSPEGIFGAVISDPGLDRERYRQRIREHPVHEGTQTIRIAQHTAPASPLCYRRGWTADVQVRTGVPAFAHIV